MTGLLLSAFCMIWVFVVWGLITESMKAEGCIDPDPHTPKTPKEKERARRAEEVHRLIRCQRGRRRAANRQRKKQ